MTIWHLCDIFYIFVTFFGQFNIFSTFLTILHLFDYLTPINANSTSRKNSDNWLKSDRMDFKQYLTAICCCVTPDVTPDVGLIT